MTAPRWRELRSGYWRRDLPDGSWLGVKPDGGRWMWLHVVGEGGCPAAQCYGWGSAAAAREHADVFANTTGLDDTA